MASSITVTFEFEIGELVFIKSATHIIGSRPKRFLILERVVQQCHGGIQLMYLLDVPNLPLRPEIALTREEPAYRPVSLEQLMDEGRGAYTRWTSGQERETSKETTSE